MVEKYQHFIPSLLRMRHAIRVRLSNAHWLAYQSIQNKSCRECWLHGLME